MQPIFETSVSKIMEIFHASSNFKGLNLYMFFVVSFPCNVINVEVSLWLFPFLVMMKQVKLFCHRKTSSVSQSILLRITSTSTLVLRRSDIEAVTQGELDATGVVVLHLAVHHAVAVEHDMVDTTIEEIVACQFDIKTVLEEVFTDTE